jgi:hypothetical protein
MCILSSYRCGNENSIVHWPWDRTCHVLHLRGSQEAGVDRVYFNSEVQDFLCYSSAAATATPSSPGNRPNSNSASAKGSVVISIKTGWASGFPVQQVCPPPMHLCRSGPALLLVDTPFTKAASRPAAM